MLYFSRYLFGHCLEAFISLALRGILSKCGCWVVLVLRRRGGECINSYFCVLVVGQG